MSRQIFDEQIEPLLHQAGHICQEHELGFVAVVEYDSERMAEMRMMQGATASSELVSIAAAATGNVDRLLLNVMRYAKRNGIPSFVADAIGRATDE